MENNNDELVVTRAPIDTTKPFYKSATINSSYSSSTARTASKPALYYSATLHVASNSYSKSYKRSDLMEEGVRKMRSDFGDL